MTATTSKPDLKDRYVVENGIPTIRTLHPVTKCPMPTLKERGNAIEKFLVARDEWRQTKLADVVNVEEIEIDLNEFGSY